MSSLAARTGFHQCEVLAAHREQAAQGKLLPRGGETSASEVAGLLSPCQPPAYMSQDKKKTPSGRQLRQAQMRALSRRSPPAGSASAEAPLGATPRG